MTDYAQLRQDYMLGSLDLADLAADPIDQFHKWFEEASNAGIQEPNAMTLATVDAAGFPNSRVVLLKDVDRGKFTFYTNYQGQKAQEMAHGKKAVSLTFLWKEIERQVHIRGTVAKVAAAESDAYFAKRPYKSQIGAWASIQSSIVASREVLEQQFSEYATLYPEGEVPRPPDWGGFAVTPFSIEFWQGRRSRLHDRLRYTRPTKGSWEINRHAP